MLPRLESHASQFMPAPLQFLNQTSIEVVPTGTLTTSGTLFAPAFDGTPLGASKPRTEPSTIAPEG